MAQATTRPNVPVFVSSTFTVKVVELALRENLSNQETLDEMRKYQISKTS